VCCLDDTKLRSAGGGFAGRRRRRDEERMTASPSSVSSSHARKLRCSYSRSTPWKTCPSASRWCGEYARPSGGIIRRRRAGVRHRIGEFDPNGGAAVGTAGFDGGESGAFGCPLFNEPCSRFRAIASPHATFASSRSRAFATSPGARQTALKQRTTRMVATKCSLGAGGERAEELGQRHLKTRRRGKAGQVISVTPRSLRDIDSGADLPPAQLTEREPRLPGVLGAFGYDVGEMGHGEVREPPLCQS